MSRQLSFVLSFTLLWLSGAALAADNDETRLKPFVLAGTTSGTLQDAARDTRAKLKAGGFDVVGEVSPYEGTTILVVTNASLKNAAAQTKFGAYGAVQRITLSKVGEQIQIAYTNPLYMANAYRMKSDLADVRAALAKAIGDEGEYGSEKGLTAKKLRKYHYKFLMPYFDEPLKLVEFSSHEAALKAVEAALAKNAGGVTKVYRVDIPGKKESVFGVKISGSEEECSGDKYIMERIDFKPMKSSGHLPYEMLVSGTMVYALPAEFRIAISFPDLSMMGSNSFASIMCAPNSLEAALTLAAGGTPGDDF